MFAREPGLLTALFAFLVASAVYLFTFPQPNIFYAVVVLLHAVVGVAVSLWLAILLYRLLRQSTVISQVGWILLSAGAILGLVLIRIGTPRSDWNWLYAHIVLSLAGAGILFAERTGKKQGFAALSRVGVCLLIVSAVGGSVTINGASRPSYRAATRRAAALSSLPMTTRSGCRQS